MATERDKAVRPKRGTAGPIEQAVRSQLRAEDGQLKGNGQPATARAAAAVELARAIDHKPAPVTCPECSHGFDVVQPPTPRDLAGLLRELRMTLKKEVSGGGGGFDVAGALGLDE